MDGGELLELHCPICYGDQGDSGYATLVCGHIFHEKCLAQSLRIKKECPSCRCPARPLDTGRRDPANQPKCPCKTGQPLRLFHLQRPRSGVEGGTAAGGGGSAVDSAMLAAVEQRAAQREARLREALQEERQRAADLEVQLEQQRDEVATAQAKAERRKQRLASMERDHQLAVARMLDDKLRLEVRERELSEELTRVRQALHGARMDLDKARAAVHEREDAVMRLKREVAMQRARAGGAAALQPREMAELLGERKEDWQAVYSMKVEELRRASEAAAELRAEVARGKADAEARVASERLAGAERFKAVAQERDEAKRELMELEYKLHEAQRRLQEAQPVALPRPPAGATAAGTVGPATVQGASRWPPAPKRPAPWQLQSRWGASAVTRHAGHGVGNGSGRGAVGGPGVHIATNNPAAVAPDGDGDDDDGDLEALALEVTGGSGDPDPEGVGGYPVEGEAGVEEGGPGAVEHGDGSGPLAAQEAGGGGGGRYEDGELAEGSAPYDLTAAAVGAPPSKRQRHDGGGGSDGGDGGGGDTAMYGSGELIDEDDPLPVLPRAFTGIFNGAGKVAAAVAAVGPGGSGASTARGSGAYGTSFASKADGALWGQSRGGGLIGEGPDGRGGTTRFPLTSSFAHNAPARKTAPSKATGRGGGRSGSGGGAAPQGRIDAFLRPIPQPSRR